MILNSTNNNSYKLLLDLDDLNSLSIDKINLFGNSSTIDKYLLEILNKLNIHISDKLTNIEIISFGFKIFHISFVIQNN